MSRQIVKLKPEFCTELETERTYLVVEDNGDRLIIQENRAKTYPAEIVPTELVRLNMVEAIQ